MRTVANFVVLFFCFDQCLCYISLNSIPVILYLSGILIPSCTISDGSFTASLAMFLAPSHSGVFLSKFAHWNVVIAHHCLSLAAVALSRSAFSTSVHPLRFRPSRYSVNASTMYKDVVIICSGAKFGTWVVSSTTAAMSDAAFVIGCILIPIFLLLPFIPFHMPHPDLGGLPFFAALF